MNTSTIDYLYEEADIIIIIEKLDKIEQLEEHEDESSGVGRLFKGWQAPTFLRVIITA